MAATMVACYTITGGPSKFDLMLALFEGKPVRFVSHDGQVLRVSVSGVEKVGSELWSVKGYLPHDFDTDRAPVRYSGPALTGPRFFHAIFSTVDRNGSLDVMSEPDVTIVLGDPEFLGLEGYPRRPGEPCPEHDPPQG